MTSPRVLFYVQHLLGIGHLRRTVALARATAEAGVDVDVISGGLPISGLALGAARLWQLPPARSAGAGDWSLLDRDGAPVDDDWRDGRRERVLELFRDRRPDVLVIELFPFGRRQMRFELLPLLAAADAAEPRPRIICSVRDIVHVRTRQDQIDEIVQLVRTYFDRVLVHGDPEVVTLDKSFSAASRIADVLSYTGYVVESPTAGNNWPGAGEVLVSAGGGAVGATLLRSAIAARPLSALKDATWRVLAGPNLGADDYRSLCRSAGPGIVVERARTDFGERLATCAISISQAGYNTVGETLAAGAKAVLVPFSGDGETEQTMRAQALSDLGLMRMVSEQALTPASLAAAVDAAMSDSAERNIQISLSGTITSARILAEYARARTTA